LEDLDIEGNTLNVPYTRYKYDVTVWIGYSRLRTCSSGGLGKKRLGFTKAGKSLNNTGTLSFSGRKLYDGFGYLTVGQGLLIHEVSRSHTTPYSL
jgi:hypothetical protein